MVILMRARNTSFGVLITGKILLLLHQVVPLGWCVWPISLQRRCSEERFVCAKLSIQGVFWVWEDPSCSSSMHVYTQDV